MPELFNYTKHVADELRRMLAQQVTLDPSTTQYTQLMQNMEILARTSDLYSDIADFFHIADQGIVGIEFAPEGVEEEEVPDNVVSLPVEPYVEEPVQFSTAAAQVSSEAPKTPDKTYEMAEVRAALVAARRNGLNVTALLKEFGVENFSAFPAGKYGELMRRIGAEEKGSE